MTRNRRAMFAGLVLTGLTPVILAAGQEPGLQQASVSPISVELREMYEADQADRQWDSPPTEEQWAEVSLRDGERRSRVLEIVRAGELENGDDYYHAAMVLQHGEGSEDILISHILATVAGFKGHEGGPWLSAASLDRYLHRTESSQWLGTQYVRASPDTPWSQGEYDDWLPDSIRAEYGVRTLADQKAYLETLNGR